MNGRQRCLRLVASLLLAGGFAVHATHACADIDDAEYEARTARRSAGERQRVQREFDRQRAQEEQRVRGKIEEQARLAAAAAARLAARPYPLRLTESRCTVCHAATNFEQQAHAWPGWLAVVLRMKYLNHAALDAGEIPVIVGHLAAAHPAAGSDAVFEYAVVPAMLAAAILPLLWVRRRRRAGRGG